MGTAVVNVRRKAHKYHYDMNNIITATVLANVYSTGPDHNSGKCMKIHRMFPQRHRKRGAA